MSIELLPQMGRTTKSEDNGTASEDCAARLSPDKEGLQPEAQWRSADDRFFFNRHLLQVAMHIGRLLNFDPLLLLGHFQYCFGQFLDPLTPPSTGVDVFNGSPLLLLSDFG